MILTISGPMHVGKTELAKRLLFRWHNTVRKPMAAPLRELLADFRLPENRESMQKVGHGFREIDKDVWVKAWLRNNGLLSVNHLVIIDDARYQNEINLGDINIFLTCGPGTQWERYQTSDKFHPDLTRDEWERGTHHSTENQWLNPHGMYQYINTDQKTAKEVEEEALRYLIDRVPLPQLKEESWHDTILNAPKDT